MKILIDTNIILRYLVKDDEDLYNKASLIFKEAENGRNKILIKIVVVAECCYVLESFYKKTKDEIASSLEILLSQKWLGVEDRQTLLSMWDDYRKNMHFVDSFLIAYSKVNKCEVLTFDNAFKKKLKK